MTVTTYYPFLSTNAQSQYLEHNEQQAKNWPIPSECTTIDTSHGQTFMRVNGPTDAPPLVLLPGGGKHSLMWIPNIEALAGVGVDWGKSSHQVCVMDCEHRIVFERSVKHNGEAIGKLADDLIARAEGHASKIAVCTETPRGAIIETLLERGMTAFSVNPKQLDRFRDRHTVAGAKDDRRDAFVLADSLKTDMKLYHPIIRIISSIRGERYRMRSEPENVIGPPLCHFERSREISFQYPKMLRIIDYV